MSETDGASEEPDWRRGETYEYTRDLPRRGWAWEFLRRNPDYRREWVPPLDKATIETTRPNFTVLTLRAGDKPFADGGCFFADSLRRDATVFWDPGQCPHVLRTAAVSAAAGIHLPHLAETPCRGTLLLTDDRDQHVLFQQAGRCLQLVASGASLRGRVRLLTEAVVDSKTLVAHLTALACLNDLRTHGRLLARHLPPERRGRRLGLVLQALDGWQAGASHRQIAAALFGQPRVDADWADPGNYLRDRVRRALRRGRALTNGGYTQFLA
jgi:hypothetical protein